MEIDITSITIIALQILIGIVLANGRTTTTEIKESIKAIFAKIDLLQSKDGCVTSHKSHDEIHRLEKEQREKDIARIQKDVDNVAEIARRGDK